MSVVPTIWIRLQEAAALNLINATLTLFGSSTSTSGLTQPLHALASMDRLATWFDRWTLGQFGRSRVLVEMAESHFLTFIFVQFLQPFSGLSEGSCSDSIPGTEMLTAIGNEPSWTHSMCILCAVASYSEGQTLLHSKIKGDFGSDLLLFPGLSPFQQLLRCLHLVLIPSNFHRLQFTHSDVMCIVIDKLSDIFSNLRVAGLWKWLEVSKNSVWQRHFSFC
jgi:hypothetical protein